MYCSLKAACIGVSNMHCCATAQHIERKNRTYRVSVYAGIQLHKEMVVSPSLRRKTVRTGINVSPQRTQRMKFISKPIPVNLVRLELLRTFRFL